MMYKERIHEEIMCIEHNINFAERMLRTTGKEYYKSYIKHQQGLLQAFKSLEQKAEHLVYADKLAAVLKPTQKRGFRLNW